MELNRANLGDIGARLEAISRSIGSEGDSKVGSAGTQGADVLKDLIDLLGKDGSIDKKDVNILKLFLELLSQLGGNGNKGGEELSRPMGGGGSGGAPQSGGPAGSQAPPASGASGGGEPAAASGAQPAPSDQRSTLQQVAQKAYDTIETSANADGKVSTMERTALDMFAKAFGLPPKSEPAPAPAPAPAPPPAASSGMTGVLRDMMDSAMKDGKIDKNEARAIGAIIDAMGGKSTLPAGDAQSMLRELLKGVSADGKFSKDDLSAFTKMLGLVSKDPGRLGPPKGGTVAAGSAGAAPEVQGRRVAQRGGDERAADDVAAQLPNVAKSFLQNTLGIGRFGGKQKMEDKDLF